MDTRRAIINGLGLRDGGGVTALIGLVEELPASWQHAVLLVHPEVAPAIRSALPPSSRLEVRTLPGARLRIVRLLLEHIILPLLFFIRGYRYLLNLGSVPSACWPGRQVVLVQSPHLYNPRSPRSLGWRAARDVLLQRLLMRLLVRYTHGFIFLTRESAKAFEQRYGAVRHVVQHWGVRLKDHCAGRGDNAPASDAGRDVLQVLSVSTLYRHKNIETVLDTVAELTRLGLPVHLTVVGDTRDATYRHELVERAAGHKLDVSWSGTLPNEKVRQMMASADAYLLLSPVETFGLTWLEAQAEELLVIAPDCELAREVLGPGAVYTDAFDPVAAAAAVLSALAERDRLARAARDNAASHDLRRTVPAFFREAERLLFGP